MKPTAIFTGTIADMRQQDQNIDYELAERTTRAMVREHSVEEEQTSRLFAGCQPIGENLSSVGWPIDEKECPYADLGTSCDLVCVDCDMKHVSMQFSLKPRSVEASIDPPCPLRIPGCRCSTEARPSTAEYYCNTGDPFMGACVQGAGNEELLDEEIEDEECFEEETEEDGGIEQEIEGDGFFAASGNKNLFNVIGGDEPLGDEDEDEELIEDDTRNFFGPQSLWPFSPVFWKGIIPPDLPPHSQSQVDYNGYSDLVNEPLTIDPQSAVAADQHARGGRSQSAVDVLQLPNPYDISSPSFVESLKTCGQNLTIVSQHNPAEEVPYFKTFMHYAIPSPSSSPFLLGSSELNNQHFEAAAKKEIERKAPSSRKAATEESRPGHKRAAVGEARSSQQPATKKDSRGWEEHEKALVKNLLEEVILEGTHARTEERWKVISRRLSSRYSVDRTWTAVKNYWNRHGRSETGIDERKVKKPDRMITGVQDPESRRQARKVKRKEAESNYGNDLVDLIDDDDDDLDSSLSSKRQRLSRPGAWGYFSVGK